LAVISERHRGSAVTARPQCRGTVEDHQALDVRELIRRRVFDHPIGTMRRCGLQWPWLITIKVNQMHLELELRAGRTESVPLAWARCGVLGNRLRLECPRCHRRVCLLYHPDGQIICRTCGRLWYAAQRTSAKGRKFLAMNRIRRKLGDHGQRWTVTLPSKPRGMWRRTYARHCAALARLERHCRRR
jgi:hypothetical protein